MKYPFKRIEYLEERVRYLEELSRFTLDALEMAASLGDFHPSINKLQDRFLILEETRARLGQIIPFLTMGFYLVDEDTQDFVLGDVQPEESARSIQEEVDHQIEVGAFAWALREKRAVIVASRDQRRNIILHALATSSRIRGMFVGLVDKEGTDIPDISLSLLSIVLVNSANALESHELYNMMRELNKSLESRKNYRLLFDAAPDGVEVLDARGNIVDCNTTLEKLLGRGREDVISRHTTDFLAERYRGLFESRLATLKRMGYWEGEVELVGACGDVVPVWRKEKAVYDEEMSFVGSVVYNHDLSMIKKAEEEKSALEAQLRRAQRMEALGALAGGVAHDLNNILASVIGYPELVLLRLPHDSPLRKPIRVIQGAGQKAASIVHDLLTLAGTGVAVHQVVNLNQIISDYFRSPEYEALCLAHPFVDFESDLDGGLHNILGSPIHLTKTIMNLILNAVEAMPHGGKIVISTANRYIDHPIQGYDDVQRGDYILMTVRDNGTGIPAEDIDRIFEPFHTRKIMGRSGTGLGLAVVWGAVKDHGGYVQVESTVGYGATFKIYLPVARQEPPHPECSEDLSGNGERILVIEDGDEQREVTSRMLSMLGYTVIGVAGGEEALDYLRTNPVELIVLDMIMDPSMDGLDIYKRILEVHPDQKAIIVSSYSETSRVREAQRLGAGTYVRKPFLLETLAAAVKRELKG